MKGQMMWGGRFKRKPTAQTIGFSASLPVDARLGKYDIQGSIAHVKMLRKVGLLKEEEAKKILQGLTEIGKELERGDFLFKPSDEDIHTAVERRLSEKVGKEVAGKLHTGRSRNDQIALDERLYVRDLLSQIDGYLRKLQQALLLWAKRYREVIMPAFTHLQHSQAILFAHWVLAYMEMFERDRQRLAEVRKRVNVSPLGAGAGGGSSLPLDPTYPAKLLKFETLFSNSLDAVSDRDFLVEVVAVSALIAVHLSRLCEELVLWSNEEFGYLKIDERYCTGSSALPQKKNPDIPELVRGKTGCVFGALVSLLTTLKGLPLSYNRDLQEDKAPFFVATDTVRDCLKICAEMIPSIQVDAERMRQSAERGYATAIDLAEFMVGKGVPFRQAHEIVGKIVKYCQAKGKCLEDLSLSELKKFSPLFREEVLEVLSPQGSVQKRKTHGSPNPKLVSEQLEKWAKALRMRG